MVQRRAATGSGYVRGCTMIPPPYSKDFLVGLLVIAAFVWTWAMLSIYFAATAIARAEVFWREILRC